MHGAGDVPLRDRQDSYSSLLIKIAREKGFYIEPSTLGDLGERISLRSKESVVYWNREKGKVFKVKDPFAATGLKRHAPEDVLYEHVVHNIFFPDTRYDFVGITEKDGELRFVLSQDFVESIRPASDRVAEQESFEKGFVRKDPYYLENEYVEVTDLSGQNAILREDGSVAFIDPVISHKIPAREIIGKYLSEDLTERQAFGAKETKRKPARRSLLQVIGSFFGIRTKDDTAQAAEQVPEKDTRKETPEIAEKDIREDNRKETEGKRSPEKMTEEEFWLLVADRDPEALKQLEETGRYEGWFLKSKDYSDVFIVEKASDGSILRQDSDKAGESIFEKYGEGEIKYDGLTFFLTRKQINEMAVGMPVELKCKETGEYSTFFYSIERNEIICKPSFEKTLKEKLYEDELERTQERGEDLVQERKAGNGIRR